VTTVRAKFRPSRALLASVKAEVGEPASRPPCRRRSRPERLARLLGLAHYIERKIEAGEVASYGEVARRLGLTQPRITQIVSLILLPPTVQERVLFGSDLGIREAIRLVDRADWAFTAESSLARKALDPIAHRWMAV
jgi:hypothetical protein